MAFELPENILESVEPGQLVEYAKLTGFRQAHVFPGRAVLLEHPSYPDLQLDIPLTKEYKDYAQAIARVVGQISEVVGCTPSRVLRDLSASGIDVFSYRVVGPDTVRNDISLLDGLKLQQSALEQLRSAAHDVVRPRRFHRMQSLKEAELYIRNCRLAPSKIGSFVASIYCPVDLAAPIGSLQQSAIPQADFDPGFARRVSTSFALKVYMAVSQLNAGAADQIVRRNLSTESAGDLTSSNLFNALGAMELSDTMASIHIDVTWSPKRRVDPGVPTHIVVEREHVKSFQEIAKRLKPARIDPSALVIGDVTALFGKGNDLGLFEGEVLIEGADHESNPVKLRVQLKSEDHERAYEYMSQLRQVSIKGQLHRMPGKLECILYSYFDFHATGEPTRARTGRR